MALESYIQWNPYNNPLANPTKEQDKLASPQDLARRSDADNNKALTSLEALILPLVYPTKDFLTKFMKAFVKSTQTQDREQTEPWK